MSDIAEQPPHDQEDDAIKRLFNRLADHWEETAPGDAESGWARLEAAIAAEEARGRS